MSLTKVTYNMIEGTVNYTSSLGIGAGGGSGAVITANIGGGAVTGFNIVNGGSGYSDIAPPIIEIFGSDTASVVGFAGSTARANAVVTNGVITAVNLVTYDGVVGGSGYTTVPSVTVHPRDDLPALQALVDSVSAAGGGQIVFDGDEDYLLSDTLVLKSNIVVRFTGSGFLKLCRMSTGGTVVTCSTNQNIKIYNAQIDANNFGWPKFYRYGENGIGMSGTNNSLFGGTIKNCRRGTNAPVGTGGKGVQIESGPQQILVDGVNVYDSTIAIESQGTLATPTSNVKGIVYTNIKAFNCERVVSIPQSNSPPDTTVQTATIVVDGVFGYNCGREGIYPTSITLPPVMVGTELDYGLIILDRAVNVTIRNVDLFNETTFGDVSSVVRIRRGVDNVVENIRFKGSAVDIVAHTSAPLTGTTGKLENNVFGPIVHQGDADYAVATVSADNANIGHNSYLIYTTTLNTGLLNVAAQTVTTNTGAFIDLLTGDKLVGFFNLISSYFSNDYESGKVGFASAVRAGLFNIDTATGGNVVINPPDGNLLIIRNTGTNMIVSGPITTAMRLPTYADNAAALAGGLLAQDLYKTATGEVRIVV